MKSNVILVFLHLKKESVIDSDLLDKLMEISEKFDYLERFREEIVDRGEWLFLKLLKNTIEKYFPDLLTEFNSHVTAERKTPI